jgi:hypothetical protein
MELWFLFDYVGEMLSICTVKSNHGNNKRSLELQHIINRMQG